MNGLKAAKLYIDEWKPVLKEATPWCVVGALIPITALVLFFGVLMVL